MSWSRFDDKFCHWPEWRGTPLAARWLYVELVNYCSRIQQDDGRFPRREVKRATDLDSPELDNCLAVLVTVELIEMQDDEVLIVRMEAEHSPPPHQRDKQRKTQQRKRTQAHRLRQCQAGKHDRHCPPSCPERGSRDG